jgi:PHS family inorganic phosphate transporter-like MFS transporter
MAAVFSMQGFGQLAATLVAFTTTLGFRDSFSTARDISDCTGECQLAADRSWRMIIGFGALPAIFALYYRLTIPETPRFTFDVALDTEKACVDIRVYLQAEEAVAEILGDSYNRRGNLSQLQSQLTPVDSLDQPRASWSDFYSYFTKYRNGSVLFATMVSWFLIDLAYYGLALNNSTILDVLGFSSGSNVYRALLATALGNLILVCAGAIPGYLLTILMIDSLGRKPIQIGGFGILTVIFCIIGFGYKSLSRGALLTLYILAQLFFNFGPNSTTFVVPGECFPTRYRSTCHGLSAACGKIGATVVQVMSEPLLMRGVAAGCKGAACSPWLAHLMKIMAATMLCGTIVSFMIPETKQQTLEVLAGEDPMRGTQRSNSSRLSKNDFLARLSSSLHLNDNRREKRRKGGGSGVHDNGAHIELENSVSSASVSSRARIFRRPRNNEDVINGQKEAADVL